MRRLAPAVLALALPSLLVACASGGDDPAPSGTGSSSGATPSAAANALPLDEADLPSGAFTWTVTLDDPAGTFVRTITGGFDADTQRWSLAHRISGDVIDATPEFTYDLVGADGSVYLTGAGLPAEQAGRWLPLEALEAVEVVGLTSDSGLPAPIAALGEATVRDVEGDELVVGVSFATGLRLLALSVDFAQVTGSMDVVQQSVAVLRVTVDDQGRPVSLRIDGEDVVVQMELPEAFLSLLRASEATVEFADDGAPVEVVVPTGPELIDPPELGGP